MRELIAAGTPGRRLLQIFGPAVAVIVVQVVLFPLSASDGGVHAGIYLLGLVFGALSALMALGMGLVYRANRIINFAQSDLGVAPTILAIGLLTFSGVPYPIAFLAGLASAVLLGIAVEFLIVRRFLRAPRLILTVATIGLSQLLALLALQVPRLWSRDPTSVSQIAPPLPWTFSVQGYQFNATHVLALLVAPAAIVAVAAFLRYTSAGVAVRASAERADRASLLGVPVKRLQMVVWVIATLLSFVAVFLRAGMVGLPFASNNGFGTVSFGTLLFALCALALGRFTDLPAIAVSAIALGVLEQAVIWNNGNDTQVVYPVVAAIILVALLLQRPGRGRVEAEGTSSWQAADEIRGIPPELRRVPEVLAARWGGLAVLVVVAWRLPSWISSSDLLLTSTVLTFAMVCLSIVVLTGWAGQVSLGQMAFVGVGGALSALATDTWGWDLLPAMALAGLAGAVTAVVVGLPALRLRGLFLGVTSLAFAIAASSYLLNPTYFDWIPRGLIERPPLLGDLDLGTGQTGPYYLALVTLAITLLAVAGLRRSRTGRVLLAQRENERGAQAYGVNLVRAKLGAFAISGFMAAVAGALFVYLLGRFDVTSVGAEQSFAVFIATVVGGLGSSVGAIIGAVFYRGGAAWLPDQWRLFVSAVGVLLVLLAAPAGLGGLWFRVRDTWLRSVARRNGIVVPSLVADVRVEEPDPLQHAEDLAEHLEAPSLEDPIVPTPGVDPSPAIADGAAGNGRPPDRRTDPHPPAPDDAPSSSAIPGGAP